MRNERDTQISNSEALFEYQKQREEIQQQRDEIQAEMEKQKEDEIAQSNAIQQAESQKEAQQTLLLREQRIAKRLARGYDYITCDLYSMLDNFAKQAGENVSYDF